MTSNHALKTTTTMIQSLTLAAAALVLAPQAAAATDKPTMADKASSAIDSAKQKLQLATLCDSCARVESTKVDRRKGKGSGIGAVGGAVAGGVVGNKTTDSTVGTVGGAAVGGLLGNEIEKRVKRTKVWVTTVTMKDGSTRKFEADSDPKWTAGTVVEVGADNKLKKH
jgi:outer membrane lipoprotein SlyB